jgi:hypothetical protein
MGENTKYFFICNKDIVMVDGRKCEIFLEIRQRFLVFNKDIVMFDGRKYEIFLYM